MTVTNIPYTGIGKTLGSSKHLGFVKVGARWYKAFGDHAHIDKQLPGENPMQGGQQTILSVDLSLNDWRLDFPYYDPDPTHVQQAYPDDGFIIGRKGEIFCWAGATNGKVVPAPFTPPGYATQVWGRLMAWTPGGFWRDVAPMVVMTMGNRAWGGAYDPVKDRFIVPVWQSYLYWAIIDGATGADLTLRPGVVVPPATIPAAKQYGNHDFHVAGMALDLTTRFGYTYDHTKTELWQVNIDTFAMTMISKLADMPQQSEGQAKIVWNNKLRAVEIYATRWHVWEVDSNTLTSADYPGTVAGDQGAFGFINKTTGNRVRPSAMIHDDDLGDTFGIGGIDWDALGSFFPNYQRIAIA